MTRPVKELKAFEKVFLNKGESKIIEFEIGNEQLAFWTINKTYEVESGQFLLMVGNSSRSEDLQCIKLKVR